MVGGKILTKSIWTKHLNNIQFQRSSNFKQIRILALKKKYNIGYLGTFYASHKMYAHFAAARLRNIITISEFSNMTIIPSLQLAIVGLAFVACAPEVLSPYIPTYINTYIRHIHIRI